MMVILTPLHAIPAPCKEKYKTAFELDPIGLINITALAANGLIKVNHIMSLCKEFLVKNYMIFILQHGSLD